MPSLPSYGSHLIEWLLEIGIVDADRPHNYTNLRASGLPLTQWELMTMRHLSAVYFGKHRKYSDEKDRSLAPHMTDAMFESARIKAEEEARRSWN